MQSLNYRILKIAHEQEPELTLSVLADDRPKQSLVKLEQEYNTGLLVVAIDIGPFDQR